MAIKIISKISTSIVLGKDRVGELKKEFIGGTIKRFHAVRVYGNATGARSMSNEKGDFVKFTGQFRAVNPETGEEVQSGALFLPPIAENFVFGALNGVESGGVMFGFDLFMVADSTSATGYVFEVSPLMDEPANDPLTVMSKQFAPMPAIEAVPMSESVDAPTTDSDSAVPSKGKGSK